MTTQRPPRRPGLTAAETLQLLKILPREHALACLARLAEGRDLYGPKHIGEVLDLALARMARRWARWDSPRSDFRADGELVLSASSQRKGPGARTPGPSQARFGSGKASTPTRNLEDTLSTQE